MACGCNKKKETVIQTKKKITSPSGNDKITREQFLKIIKARQKKKN